LHDNYLECFGGVEKETYNLVRWLNRHHPSKDVIVYFYDFAEEQYIVQLINRGRIRRVYSISNDIAGTSIFEWLLGKFNVSLCLLQHLQWHSLEYFDILKAFEVKKIFFVHDFFYYCPIPYLPAPDDGDYKTWMCTFEKNDKVCQTCDARQYWPEVDVETMRKRVKAFLSGECEYVVYVSEFVQERYQKLFDLEKRKDHIVSYPEFM
jgi:hypothetical protein